MPLAESKTWISERTIGQMLGQLRSPACEWEPGEGRPAKLTDHFHGIATTSVRKGRITYRVCGSCALLLEQGDHHA